MSILETFFILFKTDAEDADVQMKKAEATAEGLDAAMTSAAEATKEAAAATADLGAETDGWGSLDLSGFSALQAALGGAALEAAKVAQNLAPALPIHEQILRDAQDLAEAERNLTQFLLGNEEIQERTLDLLGGQKGLTERIENETKAVALALIKAQREADGLGDELADADREAKQLQQSLFGMAKSLAGPILALVSVGSLIGGLRGRVEAVGNLIERASKARVDVAAYDQWRRAIIAAGGSAETAESQFEAFAQKVGEAFGAADSDAGKALAGLKVSAKDAEGNIKPTEAALLDLADAMKGVSKQTAVDSLRRLGIVDPLMVDMILQGRDALEGMLEAQRKNGALTQEQAKRFKDFRTVLNDTKSAWTGLTDQLIGAVLPAVTAVFEAIRGGIDWLGQNRTLVQGFGIALAGALGVAAIAAATIYAPAMWAAAAATLAATWPILAIIVAVAALAAAFALAYEDVKFFLSGQPSLIGDLVNRYEWVRKAVEAIGKAFQAVKGWAGDAWGALTGGARAASPVFSALGRLLSRAFGGVASALRGVWAVAGPILALIGDALGLLGTVARQVARVALAAFRVLFGDMVANASPAFEKIGGFLSALQAAFSNVAGAARAVWGAFFGWFVDRLEKGVNLARQLISLGRDKANQSGGAAVSGIQRAQGAVAAADRAPTNATTGAAAANRRPVDRRSTTQIDKVEINTRATDARGIAAAVGPALSSEIARAQQDNDDGVAY